MKVNFNADSNKLNDFLKFPEIIYFSEDDISDNLKKMKDLNFIKESISMSNNMKKDLKFLKGDIEKFFQGRTSNNLNLMDLIYEDLSIMKYRDKDALFYKLRSMSDRELVNTLIMKILILDRYDEKDSEEVIDSKLIESELREIMSSDDNIFNFIKSSQLNLNFKWPLMVFIDNPKEYIEQYIKTMNHIYPFYEKYYTIYEKTIRRTGLELKELIEKDRGQGLARISNNILSQSIFDTDLNINIFVSFVHPNSVYLSDSIKLDRGYTSPDQNISFGINSIKILKILKREQENKKLNRIEVFKSLGDETRYKILKLIAQGASHKEIVRTLGISSTALAYNINNFVENGALIIKRVDDNINYVIDKNLLREIIRDFESDFKL